MSEIDWYDMNTPAPSNKVGVHGTLCKHGSDSCGVCGTSDRRDFVHTTEGGRGSVSRLRDKKR